MQKNRKPPGYYTALRKFIASIRTIDFMTCEGQLQTNWMVFDTSTEAQLAYGPFVLGEENRAWKRDAIDAMYDEAYKVKAYDREAIFLSIGRSLRHAFARRGLDEDNSTFLHHDAMLMASCIVAWNDPENEYTKRIAEFWNVWVAGYGVLGERDRQLYVYRKRTRTC